MSDRRDDAPGREDAVPNGTFEELDFDHLDYLVEGGIARVTIDRPDALNALDASLLLELGLALQFAESDETVHALVITGAGRAFAAGADIAALAELDDVYSGREFALQGQDVMNTLAALPFPTIAAVNGFAIGGGMELALACDLRVAAADARMGLREVALGLIPGYGGTQRLPRLIGQGRALDLILTGRLVEAREALQLGLVDRVADDALEGALELARSTLGNAPIAMGLAKEAVTRGFDLTLAQGLEVEADLFGLATATEDRAEGTRAFLEKRDPRFEGR